MSKDELKDYVLNNMFKLQSPNYLPTAIENIKKVISSNIMNESALLLILALINDRLIKEEKQNKKDLLKLLPLFAMCSNDFSVLSSSFISKILTVVQSQIRLEQNSLFGIISAVYSEIVESLFLKDATLIQRVTVDKSINDMYELVQGFCIYNIKQEEKAFNIVGSLCLNVLIQTCPLILQNCYLNYLWKNILLHLEKINFPAKTELLNCLISLIFACEDSFSPMAGKTLNIALDFLSDEDWLKRKLSLNIIYALSNYCLKDIELIKDQIINCLKVLKNDKSKEVREIAIQTLNLLKIEDDSVTAVTIPRRDDKASNEIIYSKKQIKKEENLNQSKIDKIDNLKEETKNVLENINKISAQFESKKSKEAASKPIVKTKTINNFKRKIEQDNQPKLERNKSSDEVHYKESEKVKSRQQKDIIKQETSNELKNIKESIDNLKRDKSNDKKDKEKDKDKSKIINNKMIIKRDPNYSIFKTKANVSFFENNFEKTEIDIKYKDKDKDQHDTELSIIKKEEELEKIKIAEGFSIHEQSEDNKEKYIKDINDDIIHTQIQENLQTFNPQAHVHEELENKSKHENSSKVFNNENSKLILTRLLEISQIQKELIDRIDNLERKQYEDVNLFMNKLKVIETFNRNKSHMINSVNEPTKEEIKKEESNLSKVMQLIKRNEINYGTELALSVFDEDENVLLTYLSKINISIIQQISYQNLTQILEKLYSCLKKGQYIIVIVQFLKILFIDNENKIVDKDLEEKIIMEIDHLIKTSSKYNLNEEIISDMILITKEDQLHCLINNFNN